MNKTLAMVLAGGEGQRLYPLTKVRSKPAVPFGGKYRIIDFTLSNCINSGIRQIYVLTQYRSGSLNIHIQDAWGISSSGLEEFIYAVPAQQKIGTDWYRGTADAIRQNIDLIRRQNHERVLVLSGDHVYKMDYNHILAYHQRAKADLMLAAIRVKRAEAAGTFGVLEVDSNNRLIGFEEKPAQPKAVPEAPEYAFASMGVYVFNIDTLTEAIKTGGNDFGKDIIPELLQEKKNVYLYDYEQENKIQDIVVEVKDGRRQSILADKTHDSGYWKDVGSLDSYYEASMDLLGVNPAFNLYGQKWPFRTHQRKVPPSKLVLGGIAQDSILSEGCIISGGFVRRSILSPSVIIERDSVVEDSIIFDDVTIEPLVRIRRAIIDKQVIIKNGCALGYDHEADKRYGCTISDGGIVVVPKGAQIGPA